MATMPGRSYDPYDDAEHLGIRVVYRWMRTANGLWLPDLRTIILQPRMRAIHERCVLAHELGHVCLGHRSSTPRNELLADRWAARHLIDKLELRKAANLTQDIGAWCYDLNVTADILERYLSDRAS